MEGTTHPGRRLRAARRNRDLTQTQLGALVNLSQPVISGIESGAIRWPGYVAKVAAALNVDVTELI